MKNTISYEDLKGILTATRSLIMKCSIPVFNTILITKDKAIITDLEIRIAYNLQSSIIEEPFLMSIENLKTLYSLKSDIEVTYTADNTLLVYTIVNSGHAMTSKVLPVKDFPEALNLEWHKEAEFETLFAFEQAAECVSQNDTRRVLHCVNIDTENIASTDGHRLYVYKHKAVLPEKFTCNIPVIQKWLKVFAKESGVTVYSAKIKTEDYISVIKFESKNYSVVLKCTVGTYPCYRQVIPQTFTKHVHFSPYMISNIESYLKLLPKPGKYKHTYTYYNEETFLPRNERVLETDIGLDDKLLQVAFDLGFDVIHFNDNKSTVEFTKTAETDNRTKYILMPYKPKPSTIETQNINK